MEKLILFGIALAGFTSVQAQNRTIRAEVGLNVSTTMSLTNQGSSLVPDPLLAPRIGATMEYDLSHKYKLGGLLNTYFAPGIYYKTSGYDVKSTPQKQQVDVLGGLLSSGSLKIDYLSVPLNVGTRIPLSKSASLSLEVGPTIAYALSAKQKIGDYTFDLFSGDSKTNRFELGWGSSLAIEFDKFYIRSTVENALTNFSSVTLPNGVEFSQRNSNVSFSVGYRF